MSERETIATAISMMTAQRVHAGPVSSLRSAEAARQLGVYVDRHREAIIAALRAQDREDGAREPSPGLLMSMAIRYDHALGLAGARDWKVMPSLGEREPGRHARILANTMGTMRQLWEEVTGAGFYSPDREASYVASAKACGVGFCENGRPVALPLSPARKEDGNA